MHERVWILFIRMVWLNQGIHLTKIGLEQKTETEQSTDFIWKMIDPVRPISVVAFAFHSMQRVTFRGAASYYGSLSCQTTTAEETIFSMTSLSPLAVGKDHWSGCWSVSFGCCWCCLCRKHPRVVTPM